VLAGHDSRPAVVAGLFYPASGAELRRTVESLLVGARPKRFAKRPKAVIVPHAGYVYSGAVAATAYGRLASPGAAIECVLLFGPAHRVYLEGMAWPGVSSMETPLGDVPLDVRALEVLPGVKPDRRAHEEEHSLEVQLPFLQVVAPQAKVAPIVVGRAPSSEVARAMEALWGGDETVVVVSSDLSHYLPYSAGRGRDERTARRIVSLDDRALGGDDACGAACVNGLLEVARRKHLSAELLDLRSSGDTAGSRDEVVGYGAFAFYEPGT
jgi:MEMO1 family protein